MPSPQKPPQAVPVSQRRKRSPPQKESPIPVEPVTPPPGPGHLPPLPRETAHEHRGFLLWAMMAPARRSKRAVARATGVGDITIRRWAEKRRWEDRVKLEASDRLAWQEYLGRYLPMFGIDGIATIQDSMDFPGPMTPLSVLRARLGQAGDAQAYPEESTARRVLEAAAEMSRQAMGQPIHDPPPDAQPEPPEEVELLDQGELEEDEDDPALPPSPLGNPGKEKGGKGGGRSGPEPAPPPRKRKGSQGASQGAGQGEPGPSQAQPTPQAIKGETQEEPPPPDRTISKREAASDPAQRRDRVEDYRQLIRGTLGVYARDLTQGRVKVTPKDAVLLIELEQAIAEVPKETQGQGPMESVRVRTAREQGEDVLDAVGQDLQEMAVVLEALRQKRAQEVAHLREEMSRAAQVIPLREDATG